VGRRFGLEQFRLAVSLTVQLIDGDGRVDMVDALFLFKKVAGE